VPNIKRGLESAKQQSESASRVSRIRTHFWKDGETHVVRLLSDRRDTIPAGVHINAPTKSQPKEYTGTNWQKGMTAICQNDVMFRIEENGEPTDQFEEGYGNCRVHEMLRGKKNQWGGDQSTPSPQAFGLAVIRKPKLDPVTSQVTGYQDETIEWKDDDGNVRNIPHLVILAQNYRNFWQPLEMSVFAGTSLCDRDFQITRKGRDYLPAPGDRTPEFAPGTAAWKRYEDAIALTGFSLDEYVLNLASPDWYARWFVEGAVPAEGYGRRRESEEDGDVAAAAGSTTGVTDEKPSDAQIADFRAAFQGSRS
jgi:hypothetical protein